MNQDIDCGASNMGIKMDVPDIENKQRIPQEDDKLRAHFRSQRKNTSMIKNIFLTAAVITSLTCQAKADGFSFGISIGCGFPPPVYIPPPPPVFVVPPPPVYVVPPPVVYMPPPVYVAAPPVYLAPPIVVCPPVYGLPRHGYRFHHPPASRHPGHRR